MIKLSVNLNKIALIRNSREGDYPSVVNFAQLCIDGGVQGITVHPRPDQRHIRPSDVEALSNLLNSYPELEFNIEGNPFAEPLGDYPGFISLVKDFCPHQCTLVPDSNDQLTSDHGFDLSKSGVYLEPILAELSSLGIRTSLFMDPNLEQIKEAKRIGADRIELYTGPYAAAWSEPTLLESLHKHYSEAAQLALELGLGINAGHDLNLENLQRFREIPGLEEVSIGHAFTVDSLKMGMPATIEAYLAVLSGQ